MTEIRRGDGQAQDRSSQDGAFNLARAAARVAERLSRMAERAQRDNQQLEQRRQQSSQQRQSTQQLQDDFINQRGAPSRSRAVQRVASRTALPSVAPMQQTSPEVSQGGVEAPSHIVNRVNDVRRITGDTSGAYPIRGGNETQQMLRVDYGEGPVEIGAQGDREMLTEVVERNPRAFDNFADWVNAVMELKGQQTLSEDEMIAARRVWSQPDQGFVPTTADGREAEMIFDPTTGQATETGRARQNSAQWAEGSEPVPKFFSPMDAAAATPSQQETVQARRDIMDIVRRNYESRSRSLQRANGGNPNRQDERKPVTLPSIFRAVIQRVMAEERGNRSATNAERFQRDTRNEMSGGTR